MGIRRYCYGIIRVTNENDTWYGDIRMKAVSAQIAVLFVPYKWLCIETNQIRGFAHVACNLWIRGIEIGDLCRMNPVCVVLNVQGRQTKTAIKIHSKMLEICIEINNGHTSVLCARMSMAVSLSVYAILYAQNACSVRLV